MNTHRPIPKHLRMPVRTGCYVQYRDTFKNSGYQRLVRGHVVSHEYDAEGHHNFTISDGVHQEIITTGAKLYNNLVHHIPGDAAKIERRRALKRGKRNKKRRERRFKRQGCRRRR